jgi:cation diffusion facilitator CzcD-associated flavoprotein CzcO
VQVRDPAVRKQLTPQYKLGCKRIVLSDDFYPAFNRSNVSLVTQSICKITADGLMTEDGQRYDVDAIVFATGFIVTEMEGYMRIVGRDGRVLNEEWDARGMEAYRGIHVSGYPNLALLMGPNSGLGHSSVIHVMESQMNYILSWLDHLDRVENGEYFDVMPDRQRDYNADVQRKLSRTVWATGCNSWYLDRNGHNSTVFPGLTKDYRKATARFHADDYELLDRPI